MTEPLYWLVMVFHMWDGTGATTLPTPYTQAECHAAAQEVIAMKPEDDILHLRMLCVPAAKTNSERLP